MERCVHRQVNVCQFLCLCPSFSLGSEGWLWNLTVLSLDRCLFNLITIDYSLYSTYRKSKQKNVYSAGGITLVYAKSVKNANSIRYLLKT